MHTLLLFVFKEAPQGPFLTKTACLNYWLITLVRFTVDLIKRGVLNNTEKLLVCFFERLSSVSLAAHAVNHAWFCTYKMAIATQKLRKSGWRGSLSF